MWPDYEKLEEICSIYEKANYEKWERIKELEEENKTLKERIIFLEQCLDNKEKVNKSLREEIGKLVMKQ